MRDSRCWAVAITLALVGRAAAQGIDYQADASVNSGYSQVTQQFNPPDPMPAPEDVRSTSVSTFFTEIRPGILIASGSPRVSWRLGYIFSGILSLSTDNSVGYTNNANAGLSAEVTKFTTLGLFAALAQGGSSFLLAQQAADMGQPQIRAPGNPDLVTASVGESLVTELAKHTSLHESVYAALSAPQNDLAARSSSLSGSLSINQTLDDRDAIGLEARASVATLTTLDATTPPYTVTASSIRGRWSRDFTQQWNAYASAGVGQAFTDTGSKPLAFYPVGNLAMRYSFGPNAVGAIDYIHDAAINLQVGTVSLTDQVTARGIYTLDPAKLRTLSFSAGALHNQPIGEASALVVASTGYAVQGDVGFTTALRRNVLATARYSIAYQFDQAGNLGPTLLHIFFIGVTGRYSSSERPLRPLPTRGERVDGSDAQGVVEKTEPPEPPPSR